jgi:hypothetical protein
MYEYASDQCTSDHDTSTRESDHSLPVAATATLAQEANIVLPDLSPQEVTSGPPTLLGRPSEGVGGPARQPDPQPQHLDSFHWQPLPQELEALK